MKKFTAIMLATFLIIGTISIIPTITFAKSAITIVNQQIEEVPPDEGPHKPGDQELPSEEEPQEEVQIEEQPGEDTQQTTEEEVQDAPEAEGESPSELAQTGSNDLYYHIIGIAIMFIGFALLFNRRFIVGKNEV